MTKKETPLFLQTLAEQTFTYGDLVPGDKLRHAFMDGGNSPYGDMSVTRVREGSPGYIGTNMVTITVMRPYVHVDEELGIGFIGVETFDLIKPKSTKLDYPLVERANSIRYPAVKESK
jgi:hypothetical protein